VANLVDGFVFLSREIPVLIDSIFFQEIPHFIPRAEEVVIPDMVIVACREFGQRMFIKI